MKKQLKPHLKQAAGLQLPAGEFCRTVSCWSCIHFIASEPDSQGQCRCSYRGRWYYPHEGCTNGTPRIEFMQMQQEELARRQREIEGQIQRSIAAQKASQRNLEHQRQSIPSSSYRTSGTGSSSGSDGASSAGGLFFLLAIIGTLLFNTGLMKTELAVRLTSGDPAVCQTQLVHWEDGDRSINDFSNYTALHRSFNEYGTARSKLKIGKYDIWLSRDGVSGYIKHIYNDDFLDGFFGINADVHEGSVDHGSLLAVHLTVQGGSDSQLTVTDENGSPLRCAGYGEGNEYVLLLPQGDSPIRQVTLTMEGFEAQTLKLDFTDSRLLRKTVRFHTN